MCDDMITDMEANEKLSPIVIELFLGDRRVNILLVFISQSYSILRKTITLNVTDYFIKKILNKRELLQIASNQSSDIDFKDFMKLYKDYTKKLDSFIVNDTTFPSNNTLRFKKSLI